MCDIKVLLSEFDSQNIVAHIEYKEKHSELTCIIHKSDLITDWRFNDYRGKGYSCSTDGDGPARDHELLSHHTTAEASKGTSI